MLHYSGECGHSFLFAWLFNLVSWGFCLWSGIPNLSSDIALWSLIGWKSKILAGPEILRARNPLKKLMDHLIFSTSPTGIPVPLPTFVLEIPSAWPVFFKSLASNLRGKEPQKKEIVTKLTSIISMNCVIHWDIMNVFLSIFALEIF